MSSLSSWARDFIWCFVLVVAVIFGLPELAHCASTTAATMQAPEKPVAVQLLIALGIGSCSIYAIIRILEGVRHAVRVHRKEVLPNSPLGDRERLATLQPMEASDGT